MKAILLLLCLLLPSPAHAVNMYSARRSTVTQVNCEPTFYRLSLRVTVYTTVGEYAFYYPMDRADDEFWGHIQSSLGNRFGDFYGPAEWR